MKRFPRPDRYFRLGCYHSPRQVDVRFSGAPNYMQGLRALFVSDVHLRRRIKNADLDALMGQLAEINCDILLLGGDYGEGADQCARFFSALARLRRPRLGGFGVMGNNDVDSRDNLRALMANAGVTLLFNEARSIDLPGGRLTIGGCDEYKYGFPETRNLFQEDAGYRLLLSHFPAVPDCKCDLMLCGHTHGGQMNFLGLNPYSIGFELRYRLLDVRGVGRYGKMDYLVGNGLGVSRLPLRMGAEPQIYLVEFTK